MLLEVLSLKKSLKGTTYPASKYENPQNVVACFCITSEFNTAASLMMDLMRRMKENQYFRKTYPATKHELNPEHECPQRVTLLHDRWFHVQLETENQRCIGAGV